MRDRSAWTAVSALAGGLLCLAAGPAAAKVSCRTETLANAGPYQNGGTYLLCYVDKHLFPDALCNDGSVPVFQVQPTPGSSKWVIWLAGGFQCVNAAQCEQRATDPKTHALVTSRGVRAVVGQGVLDHDPNLNPALADANTVLVHYCSSDAWSGGYRAPNGPGGFVAGDPRTWNFEGHAIARAAVGSLHELGLGFSQATEVVLGGSSAGAAGITYTAREILPKLPPQAKVVLANDAGFVLDVGRFDPTLPAPYEDTVRATPNFVQLNQGRELWHGHADPACNAQASTPAARTECYDTSTLLQGGYVPAPAFVAQSLLDLPTLDFQLCPGKNGACAVPHDPDSKRGVYATHFAQQMAERLEGNGASVPYSAYAPDIYIHTMLNSDAAFAAAQSFPQGALAPRDAFNPWLANPGGAGQVLVGNAPGVQ